ncbi:hypothetical protein V2J09_020977 [Rumex salicifolius]
MDAILRSDPLSTVLSPTRILTHASKCTLMRGSTRFLMIVALNMKFIACSNIGVVYQAIALAYLDPITSKRSRHFLQHPSMFYVTMYVHLFYVNIVLH